MFAPGGGTALQPVAEREDLMPRTAEGRSLVFPGPSPGPPPALAEAGPGFSPADRALLLGLARQALEYFLDNQVPNGLVLDRQANHGPRRPHGPCSTSATGMGFIALALATAPPYSLISSREASLRITAGLRTALDGLPHDGGIMPHFISSATGEVWGADVLSTVDSAWLAAGGLWSAAFLEDAALEALAACVYDRIDWGSWTAPDAPGACGLLRHGRGRQGDLLACCWDRLNGETAFMYVLGGGAAEGRALPPSSWAALRPFYGTAAGRRFNNADLGLFVFQYGLDLLDLRAWRAPGDTDLWAEAREASLANEEACRLAADRFATYRRFWGLSAGDGPGEGGGPDVYRTYAPGGLTDGTAHLTATLASAAHHPEGVLANVRAARGGRPEAAGRYGLSSVNLDRGWVARDMVGIDAGAAVLALDNCLADGRVRRVFHGLPCVQRGLARFGFTPRETGSPHELPTVRRAS
jgi:hypothetical protein